MELVEYALVNLIFQVSYLSITMVTWWLYCSKGAWWEHIV